MEKSNYVSEGIILGAFTLASYIIAFKYESGFCSYWQIPTYFIEIPLTAVVAAGLSLFVFLFWIFLIMNLPIALLDKELSQEDSLRRRVVIFHLGFVAVLIALLQGYGFSFATLFLLLIVLVIDGIFLLFPWWSDKRKNPSDAGFFERIKRSNGAAYEPKDGFRWFCSLTGSKPYYLLLVIIPIINLISSAAGAADARNAKHFLVIEQQNLMLIKKYGDTFIFRPIDFSSNKVADEIIVWAAEDVSKHRLSIRMLKDPELSKH